MLELALVKLYIPDSTFVYLFTKQVNFKKYLQYKYFNSNENIGNRYFLFFFFLNNWLTNPCFFFAKMKNEEVYFIPS